MCGDYNGMVHKTSAVELRGGTAVRLITRSDFDGLVCAMLFKKLGMIDEMKFVHPKDVQDGLIEVNENDILANVPYVAGHGLWFDHHSSEIERNAEQVGVKGEVRIAPSAARVVYDYYGGKERFGDIDDIMEGVDKADAAQFSADDILNPKRWDLLSFIMDARTGLGRYRDYRISNYQLMEDLVDHCATMTIEEILELPDVKERVNRYFELDKEYKAIFLTIYANGRQCHHYGPARGGDDLSGEPLHGVCALSGAEHLHLGDRRKGQAECRVCLRPQHH